MSENGNGDPVSIINVIMVKAAEAIADALDLDANEQTSSGFVKIGKLQDDPTIAQVNIMVHPGGDKWRHELSIDPKGIDAPAYVTSGEGYWWRRFTAQLQMNLENIDRGIARTKANYVLSKAELGLIHINPRWGVDDFGEAAIACQVRDSFVREGGGAGMFIWNGEIRFEFLTIKDMLPPEI
jgi:hypothetical protein